MRHLVSSDFDFAQSGIVRRHAELVSASQETLKQIQGDGDVSKVIYHKF